ncbi:alpha-amylase [Thermosipho ferrireducens]|uniref:Alpha-amylase n=1 Tax=Thermosipho ferrireducens TaxID=2571116 RepID=A0ABX7S7I1_9BACT|nr:alpha-amylase family glycosyl hydrolase [Thermosipho ferrireducens]QTA37760.1 alpha-amylase [Thermosipho ferrireducens]
MKKFLFLVILLLLTAIIFGNWQDKVLYFIMIDRFNDGNVSNNDQGMNEYNPGDGAKYSGGDLEGILQKLEYIKGMGFDGIWITPPVANQWWDPWVHYGGYHGYWARDFKKVDEHFGDLEIYKKLSEELHRNNMVLIQDIVVNHVGNYFRFKNGKFELNTGSVPTNAPTQYPFNLNDYTKPEVRKKAIYHWTPDINDFSDKNQKLNYQLSGLDDLNTENPEVRKALKDSYKYWIKQVGVDGFRVDTAMYVPKDFWKDFFLSKDGIYAQKDNFISFGEVWLTSKPMDDSAEKEIETYFDTGFNAMLDFPLNEEIKRVIKGGQPTQYLAYRIERRNETLKKGLLVTFIDNHDMERFGKGTIPVVTKMALTVLMTLPGMPVVYYGTEQYFEETRASMFENGWGSGGINHFDKTSDMYKFISELISFRKKHTATRYGKVKALIYEERGAGVLAYSLEDDNEKLVVVLNTAEDVKIAKIKTEFEAGTVLTPIFNVKGKTTKLVVKGNGELITTIPGKSVTVYEVSNEKRSVRTSNLFVKVNLKDGMSIDDKFVLTGETNAKYVYIYLDRKYNNKIKLEVKDGKFEYVIDPLRFDPGKHILLIKARGKSLKDVLYTDEISFLVSLEVRDLAFVIDPKDDDHGPKGTYVYPTDPTFKRQMDILGARVQAIGPTLVIYIKPREITKSWSPIHGFDHVTYQIFLDNPEKEGAKYLPFQNYKIDDWDYEIFVTGWSSALYSAKNADKNQFGTQVGSPELIVEDGWIKIIVKGDNLGNPEDYSGWKIYITSWDYDGVESRFRPISKEPKAYVFGGGNNTDPYIMDDLWIEIQE